MFEEKAVQLAKSEKYFRTLIETSSDAIVLMDAAGKVLYQTPSTEKILGYKLAEIQEIDGIELIHPDDREDDNKMFVELISNPGLLFHRKHRIKHKDGSYIQIEGTYRNLLNDESVQAIVYSYKDITEKVLAEQNLMESESRFRSAFEDSAIGMGLVSPEGRWIKVNRSLYEMLGYTEDELLSLTFQQITHPDDLDKDVVLFGKALKGEINTYRMEKRYFHKNGRIIWINLNVSMIFDQDKRAMYCVSQIENITEKVLSEQNLARYNRELTLLNKINDIILRVSDEQQLYREVCDCIVTFGNYKLAWVCHRPEETDADQIVKPLVVAGIMDYLSDVKINLNDPQQANGPTGTVLRSRKTFVNNDMNNAAFFAPWVERAKKHGIQASVALFLDLGSRKTGALMIYAGQTNAFDQHEVAILERLAANLSIAVQHIHNREELVESENRFRSAFEDSAIGMGLTSIKENSMGRWLKVNRSLCQMLGYTEDELLSLTFMQITHPDDLALDLAAQDLVLHGESDTYRLEKRYIHKDGSSIWINLNVSIVKDKDNRPVYFVAQVENITEKVESQLKFQNLVENFTVGVYILQDNKLAYVNPRVIEETGYTDDEIIGMPFEKFIYPADLELVSDIINIRTKQSIKAVRYEVRITRKNGEPLWYEILGGSTIYQGVPALIGTMVNITERKAVDDELKRSEANLKSIFDTTEVSYLLMDSEYNIIALNQNMKDVYLRSTGLLLNVGGNLRENLAPEERERTLGAFERVLDKGEPVDYETSFGWSGTIKHFTANIKAIYKGDKIIGLCIAAIDITERKAIYDELERSEANLRSIFDTTDVSYLLLDRDYNIIALNQHMKDIYIHAAGVVLNEGDALMEVIPLENRERARTAYDKVMKNNKALDYETTYINNGISIHFLANVKPINDGKNVIGLCISSIDITERKNALEQLKHLNENLQKKAKELAISNAELEQFAYVASHDLQEPLRMVTSFLTQLEKKYSGVLDEKAKQYIYFATDGAKRMRQLILDLLEYSRVGRTETNPEEVNFNDLVEDVLILFKKNIEESNATVQFRDLPTITIDKTPVRQVLHNLIGNALKYHDPDSAPIVEISSTETKTAFEFIVSDNGIGIEPEYFDQIFIIFKRLHNREEYAGTGMGLAITKKIVEHMGGRIWVASKEGQGSAFHFTIPKHLKQ